MRRLISTFLCFFVFTVQALAGSQDGSNKASLEGCIVAQSGDYFLVPKNGKPLLLKGADVSHHAGEHVNAYGTQNALNGAGSSSTSGAPESSASNPTRSTGPYASEEDFRAQADTEMLVNRIETISNTCPGGWNPTFPVRK